MTLIGISVLKVDRWLCHWGYYFQLVVLLAELWKLYVDHVAIY